MLDFSHLNYWAILAALIINVVVGAFWYSPLGFGKLWSKLTGINMMKMPKNEANRGMFTTAIAAIVQSFLLAVMVTSLHITTVWHGVDLGLVLWIGFVAATTVSDAMYARRGWGLWFLNASYYLVVLVVNGAILALWQ